MWNVCYCVSIHILANSTLYNQTTFTDSLVSLNGMTTLNSKDCNIFFKTMIEVQLKDQIPNVNQLQNVTFFMCSF